MSIGRVGHNIMCQVYMKADGFLELKSYETPHKETNIGGALIKETHTPSHGMKVQITKNKWKILKANGGDWTN